MHAEAYARARKLLSEQRGVEVTSVLGVIHSLLLVLFLVVVGLLTALLASQGEARYPTHKVNELPPWVAGRATGQDQDLTLFDDTGLLPIVTGNLNSPNPIHSAGASFVLRILGVFPTLRNNIGALATLLAIGLGLLLALSLIAQYRRSRIAEAVGGVATSLRRQIHRQMYRLGQSSLATEGTGPVVNLLTREVNDIRDGLYAELADKFRMPVLAVGLFILALGLSWELTLFLGSLGVLVWLTARAMQRDARLASDAAMRDAAVHLSLLHEDLGLLRTVRVYGMEKIDNQRFDEHLERFRHADARRMKADARITPTSWLMYGAAVALALGLLGYSVVAARRIAPASGLVMIAALIGLVHPVMAWLKTGKAIRQANRSAGAVFEFLDRKPELHQLGGAQFLPPLKEKISLENVTLESHSGRVLLEGVSLDFPAGSKTAIMGLDEDSKHAVTYLIPRLIDPKSGHVKIDGHDLKEVTLESIRAQVATVLQADLVFTDSVTMNIGLGDPSYTTPRIVEAAKVAHAHNFIQDLPHGYDTIVGPLGHYLKPDEQYRIALARAYLHDPSIVILEEPSVALDDDTKSLVDDTISRLSRGRTLIFLPHRLSTIRSCQQIVVIHNGKIESIGSPRDLQGESKLFRHLQYVEFNQFATGELEMGQMNG